MIMYEVILRWIEAIGPKGDWNAEHDEYYLQAESEIEAIFKACLILDYQCSDYGEGSEVRVHYASAQPIDYSVDCDYEGYFAEGGVAHGKDYPHYVDRYSMKIISPDSLEYLPELLRKASEKAN